MLCVKSRLCVRHVCMYQHACMEKCLSQCFFLCLLRFIFLFFLLQFLLFTTCLHHVSSLYASSYISIFMLGFMLLDLHTYTSHYAPLPSRAIRRLVFWGGDPFSKSKQAPGRKTRIWKIPRNVAKPKLPRRPRLLACAYRRLGLRWLGLRRIPAVA